MHEITPNISTGMTRPPNIVSEMEITMMEQLTNYEKEISNQLKKLENESRTNKESRKDLFKQCEKEISIVFDEWIEKFEKRKQILINKVQTMLNNNEKQEAQSLAKFKEIKLNLNKAKQEYHLNLEKYTNMSEITLRRDTNCQMIQQVLLDNLALQLNDRNMNDMNNNDGCEVKDADNSSSSSSYINTPGSANINLIVPKLAIGFNQEMLKFLDAIVGNLGDVGTCNNYNDDSDHKKNEYSCNYNCKYNNYKYKTQDWIPEPLRRNETIIISPSQFESNKVHTFDMLRISGKNGILTVNPCNVQTDTGGLLIIRCNSLILEKNGSICVDGIGYSGGRKLGDSGRSGSSDSSGGGHACKSNNSRGLLGWTSINFGQNTSTGCGGGGGGYGTPGWKGFGNESGGLGGSSYGDAKLFELNGKNVHLGSGGGCGIDRNGYAVLGSPGGGAVIIDARDCIIIGDGCKISACGGCRDDVRSLGGGGSGGSIYLRALNVVINNKGKVIATGGRRKNSDSIFGSGGAGRIRVDCENDLKLGKSAKQFIPEIEYLGKYESYHDVE